MVNFFGHAAAARHVEDDPAFLIGAMAPDLLPMCGAIAAEPTCAKVSAGQAHHVLADARFHGTKAFTMLAAWAARKLIEAGVPRGPSRGAAHVAIELFLDGVLAEDGAASQPIAAVSPKRTAVNRRSCGRTSRPVGAGVRSCCACGPERSPAITERPISLPTRTACSGGAADGPRRSRGDEAAGISPRAQKTGQPGSGRAWRWTGDRPAAFARSGFRQRRLSGSCERAPAGIPPVTSAAVRRPFVHSVRSVMIR